MAGSGNVPSRETTPNLPELRPIETFWAVVKDKLRRTGKVFKNDKDLKKEWMKVCKRWHKRCTEFAG